MFIIIKGIIKKNLSGIVQSYKCQEIFASKHIMANKN